MRTVRVAGRNLTDPDVAVVDFTAMILKRERKLVRMRCYGVAHLPGRETVHFPVILHNHAVEEHRNAGGMKKFDSIPDRLMEYDIVSLPLTGLAGGVHHRRILGVDCAGLTVGIVGVLHVRWVRAIGLKNLNLVIVHEKHAGVAVHLRTFFVGNDSARLWMTELDMQLAVAERLAGEDVSAVLPARDGIEIPFFGKLPTGRLTVLVAPVLLKGLLGSVEKYGCVTWNAACIGRNLHGIRAVAVMDAPCMLGIGRISENTGCGRGENRYCRTNGNDTR